MRYGLMSRETSFVAIERRETPVLGDMQLRRMPIALTTGWGGLDRIGRLGAPMVARAAMPFAATMSTAFLLDGDTAMAEMAPPPGRSWLRAASRRKASRRYPVVPDAPAPAVPRSDDPIARMHALVALQRADGSWDLTNELADLIARPLAQLASAMPTQAHGVDARHAWATALALAWLRTEGAVFEDQWRLLADKALRWLEREVATAEARGAHLEAATVFLRS